jgi:NADH-quinone oxidoreductase subunit G
MSDSLGDSNKGQTQVEMVTLTIDGKELSVPKGTNLIEAAKTIGVEIPHYCYHPDLSIAGNCRMCQVKVEGAPKMEIACNCQVRAGMKVLTQHTSKEVADTQAATLEFILINHPLDCTICDQAGHCKLQDYHFQYNAQASRFLEEKEHKPKAVELGPTVTLDGERCIMCTRCIRFCDEITETSELGMLNRGDRSVIAVNDGRQLNNPFSGSVVDLCPVGALTHSQWRFNTRIWFTKQVDSICPGCSTGCNVKVASRDGKIVNVKARYNKEVNKEWLCDQGRYGFNDFLPEHRLSSPLKLNSSNESVGISWAEALTSMKTLQEVDNLVVVAAGDLLLEEYALLQEILSKSFKHVHKAVNYRERSLTELEAKLISPDRSANYKAAQLSGLIGDDLSAAYEVALAKIRHGQAGGLILVGNKALREEDLDPQLLAGLAKIPFSVGLIADAKSALISALKLVIPTRSILEKSGLLVNRNNKVQYTRRALDPAKGSEPDWRVLMRWGNLLGFNYSEPESERDMTLKFLAGNDKFRNISMKELTSGALTVL